MDLPDYNTDDEDDSDEEFIIEEMTAEEINSKLSKFF